MDLLLIHVEAGIMSLQISTLPPLGLIQLATYLKSHGFDCSVIDARHRDFSIDWFFDYLARTRPRWVGISVLADTVFAARRLIGIVRKASPETRVVVGGAHATVRPEEVFQDLKPDVVVLGEGEIPSAELLSRSKPSDVRGIMFRDGNGFVRTQPAPLVDMDDLPSPDYTLVQNFKELSYQTTAHTGRGCPYRCSFCAAPILGPKVHVRSIAKVMEDIELATRATGNRYVWITDDTFTFDGRRVREFCKAIRRIGGGKDLFWYCEGRIDRLARDPSLIKEMKGAGCSIMQLGVESGDERVLEAYRKEIRLDDVRKVIRALTDERILSHAGFIVGGPFESPNTIARTQKLLHELAEISRGLMQIKLSFLNPLPATDVYEHPERYGIRLLDPGLLSSVYFDNAVTETDSLSREDIFRAQRRVGEEAISLLKESFDSQDEAFHSYMTDLFGRIGPEHISFAFLSKISHVESSKMLTQHFFKIAGEYKQLYTFGHEHSLDLVPSRIPIFDVGEDGRYRVGASKVQLTEDESDVLHYASSKLTGREIAFLLEMEDERIRKVFKDLEDKKAIVYRAY